MSSPFRWTTRAVLATATLAMLATAALAAAQGHKDYRVDIAWNRLHDYDEVIGIAKQLEATWPSFVTLQSIGKSYEGRDMWLLSLNNKHTGSDRDKPAFYSDANIHGNEVQGAEANLYLIWYLCEHYDKVDRVKALVDRVAFYVLPSVNVDGRAAWFREANTSSSQRAPRKPFDDDLDGRFDEDAADDLDGDGHITRMRKKVPLGEGRWRDHDDEPGVMVRATGDDEGDYVMLGSEGIDNDGDGRFNEDGPGYYDMNRNWPSSWNPNHLQRGAGEYPLSHAETRHIAEFILGHPNIAGVQAFHNAGGMILRGPGLKQYGKYPRKDRAVYDELGREGQFMLPFYRYMIIHKDLYSVAGGFVNWTAEGLGIFSFTNEMWSRSRMRQSSESMSSADRRKWDNLMTFGENYVEWHEFEHPFYGPIEIGGPKQMTGRVPPTWLIEEGLHRNAAFVAYHAGEMPHVELVDLKVQPVRNHAGDATPGLHYVDVKVKNHKLIPTRSQIAATNKIGQPDSLEFISDHLEVVAGGLPTDRWRLERIDLQARNPRVLLSEDGVPSEDEWHARWIVAGDGGEFEIRFRAEKATNRSIMGVVE